jgi:hypothetical protein
MRTIPVEYIGVRRPLLCEAYPISGACDCTARYRIEDTYYCKRHALIVCFVSLLQETVK